MEKGKPKRRWNPKDELRLFPYQPFIADHKKDVGSPRGGPRGSPRGSPMRSPMRSPMASPMRNPTQNPISTDRRRATISAKERDGSVGTRERGPVERRGTVDTIIGNDSFEKSAGHGGITSPPLQNVSEAKAAIKAMDSWPVSTIDWEKTAHSDDLSQISPFTTSWKFKDNSGYGSELQSSEAEQSESIYDENIPKPRLTNVPNEGDNRQGRIEQMKRNAKEDYPPKPLPKDRDRDHDSGLQSPESGKALSDDDGIIRKDYGSGSPSNERKTDTFIVPRSPESDHVIDETSEHENQAFSDEGQAEDDTIDETSGRESQAVSDEGQTPEGAGTASETPSPIRTSERDGLGSQPRAGSMSTLVDASPMHEPVEEQFDPETNTTKEAHDITRYFGTMENESHVSSSGIDHITSPDSQAKLPGSDGTRSPDSQPQSPEPGGVTVETNSTQDQVGEDVDPESRLNSDTPLPQIYRDISDSPRSTSPDRSSNPGSGTDSLILSSDDQEDSEEEGDPSAAIANEEIMRLFDEYSANSRLEPYSDEQEAEGASETPIILSPARPDDENATNSEALQDELEEARKKEASRAALEIYDLYGANFRLQKELEEKEARFKREIQIAWKHPRPPPTTREQELDRLALEDIKSKRIFDETGAPQRPIRTDPQMVLLETQVDIMIFRARINHLLEDYPSMYAHANHAAEAARPLKFPILTARCFYYRGMASYLYRDFARAKDDFLASRDCAGFYGIPSVSIERYIELIDNADDPETAIIEHFPARRSSEVRKIEQKRKTRRTDVDHENEPSPSTSNSATTLVGGSPRSPAAIPLPLSPFSSPNGEEHSAGQSREDANSRIETPRGPSHLSGLRPDRDPQPSIDDVPNYHPQDEAISEEIRKDILESKAQSLNPVTASEAGPSEVTSQNRNTLSPPSMASTEWTLLGSKTSQGTTRRVPRPHVAPINTSLATVARTPAREASQEATPASDIADEMDSAVIRGDLNTVREDATPNTAEGSDVEELV